MDINTLTNLERLREWYEAAPHESLQILIKEFRNNSSPAHREIVWKAFLELTSQATNEFYKGGWRDELINALKHNNPAIRSQALSAFADVATYLTDDHDIRNALVRALYDESEDIRGKAIYASSCIANEQLLWKIMNSLSNPASYRPSADDADRRCVWHALFAMDDIIDRISLSADEMKQLAQQMLEVLKNLLEMPTHSNLDIWKVGDSLGEHIRGTHALTVLKQMFDHLDPVVRDSAVHGLGHLGGHEALQLLTLALSDSDFDVRDEAHRAIAEINGHEFFQRD